LYLRKIDAIIKANRSTQKAAGGGFLKGLRLARSNRTKGGKRTELKAYRRDSLLGALGALLMLVGDLCLSVIPASAGDSGKSAQAYLIT
jgi:hypothetical protein